MKLNSIFGYGQLFGYSGIDGKNNYYKDFIGILTNKKIEIRFELEKWISFYFPIDDIKFKAVMSDFIDGSSNKGDFFITFESSDILVGYSPVKIEVNSEGKIKYITKDDIEIYKVKNDYIFIKYIYENGLYRFTIYHSNKLNDIKHVKEYSSHDIESLKKKRYEYYNNIPQCVDPKYEELYYKALSVNKVNVYSPLGKIKYRWTTPDRVPHRHMWLWDSVFHALSFLEYDSEMAKDAIRSVLSLQRKDGFIAHMMTPKTISNITQPQVLSWCVYEIYKKTNDKDFLKENVDKLDGYLTWDIKHRDKNKNGLLEWATNPFNKNCKCDESGLDNSPRFDFDLDMDAIDFSTYSCRDAKYLSLIYKELGNNKKSQEWLEYHEKTKKLINDLMFDKDTGAYYDRLFNGKLTKVLTPLSFLPLFASIPSKEQASLMVKTLTNEELLWTPFPLSTISKKHETYSTDMWRGGTWINLNYFIYLGLLEYGYKDIALELKTKTLDNILRWYKETGVIYEFYDSNNKVNPIYCERKGKQGEIVDYRKHIHSISDFNWSSCFTLLFIKDKI